MSQNSVEIRLLDRQYRIQCDEDQLPTLQLAGHRVEQEVKRLQTTQKISEHDALVMTALNLCAKQTMSTASAPVATGPDVQHADQTQLALDE